MLSQDDIDAFECTQPSAELPDAAYKKILGEAKNLAYEFDPDYLYRLLFYMKMYGHLLKPEQMMKIAYEAKGVWEIEHN